MNGLRWFRNSWTISKPWKYVLDISLVTKHQCLKCLLRMKRCEDAIRPTFHKWLIINGVTGTSHRFCRLFCSAIRCRGSLAINEAIGHGQNASGGHHNAERRRLQIGAFVCPTHLPLHRYSPGRRRFLLSCMKTAPFESIKLFFGSTVVVVVGSGDPKRAPLITSQSACLPRAPVADLLFVRWYVLGMNHPRPVFSRRQVKGWFFFVLGFNSAHPKTCRAINNSLDSIPVRWVIFCSVSRPAVLSESEERAKKQLCMRWGTQQRPTCGGVFIRAVGVPTLA